MSQRGMMIPPKHLAFFYNLKQIFGYKPQTQEYLYKQLFEDSERKSVRGSLIFSHMQVVDECRQGDPATTSNFGGGSSDAATFTKRGTKTMV